MATLSHSSLDGKLPNLKVLRLESNRLDSWSVDVEALVVVWEDHCTQRGDLRIICEDMGDWLTG